MAAMALAEASARDVDQTRTRLRDLLDDPQAMADLVAYFDPAGPFAGDTFDTLGHEVKVCDPDSYCAHDVEAPSLLDEPIPPLAVRQLLFDQTLRATIGRNLADISVEATLWDCDEATLVAADRLWSVLDELEGLGSTRVSKLLSRKRSNLVPITDSVVRGFLGTTDGDYWSVLRGVLRTDAELVSALQDMHARLESRPRVSTLRILDVLMWMNGRIDR